MTAEQPDPLDEQGAVDARGLLALPPASFPRRTLAFVIDNVLVLFSVVLLLVLFSWSIGDDGYWVGFLIGYLFFFSFPLIALYWSVTLALWERISGGRSPGRALCGIAVRDARTGGSVGFSRLLGREVFRGLLALLLFVPLVADGLSALWNGRRQTWHDKIAGTVVVRTRGALLPRRQHH